jgi:hypothetical protein
MSKKVQEEKKEMLASVDKLQLDDFETITVAESYAKKNNDAFGKYFLRQLDDENESPKNVLETAKIIIGKHLKNNKK